MENQFVHLHNHSEYSLLDGFSKLNDMAATAAKLGQPAIALTDHGVVHGAVDFYKFANLSGVKPIIGMEGYVTDGSRLEKNRDQTIRHITLILSLIHI